LIPLTAPKGAGLRLWNPNQTEIFYQLGKAYSFNARLFHAIRPFPYMEWQRSSARITVQAFGVQCDDKKWYVYH
jgi:hypothetical protein